MEHDHSLALPLSEEEHRTLQYKLWQFLGQRTARYTMGESSSVPMATAQELFTSILFTLQLSGASPHTLLSGPIEEHYQRGLAVIEHELERGRSLWQAVYNSSPKVENISYLDTISNILHFFRQYDYRFFAHQIPCDIDYQLCRPVPEHLPGISYINQYLTHLLTENKLLQRFRPNFVIDLLERYCPD